MRFVRFVRHLRGGEIDFLSGGDTLGLSISSVCSLYLVYSNLINSGANWQHGGTLLSSHRLPILPPTNSSPAHVATDSNGTVTSLAIDSEYVVVGLANSNIKVFSAKTGVLARTLTGHDSGVWGVCLISKGGRMDRGRGNGPGKGKGRVVEGLSKEMTSALGFELEERTIEDGVGCERPSFMSNSSIGWGQPNSIVISGGCDKLLKVWDPKSGYVNLVPSFPLCSNSPSFRQCIYTLSGHTATIRCLRTMHNTPLAVTGSRDATLRVWDVQLGVCLRVLEGHAQSVRCLDVCGRRVVSGSYDNTCRVRIGFLPCPSPNLLTLCRYGTLIQGSVCMSSEDTFTKFIPSRLMGFG